MNQYIIRLDDASEYMDLPKWTFMEALLEKYNIRPIFGIIPKNEDKSLITKYEYNSKFWELMHVWIDKGWTPAMHGYEHRYVTEEGGMNPVNKKSEFAGLSYEEQALKIYKGYQIFLEHSIAPEIFFAPSHTFDKNTLKAIKYKTNIRIISDTIAGDCYKMDDLYFIPQQAGNVRKLPFKIVTFCYHPNSMRQIDFRNLEIFLNKYNAKFINKPLELDMERKYSLIDFAIMQAYFLFRNVRARIR